ncbi:RPM1-interacting protein 4-like protein isoform X2 [Tanacetum coccineum]
MNFALHIARRVEQAIHTEALAKATIEVEANVPTGYSSEQITVTEFGDWDDNDPTSGERYTKYLTKHG